MVISLLRWFAASAIYWLWVRCEDANLGELGSNPYEGPFVEDTIDKTVHVKSRFSFNITHKEVFDEHNSGLFYWLKDLEKGLYFETKDVEEGQGDSVSCFYKIQRNDKHKWKLKNVTDTISPDKIQRIKDDVFLDSGFPSDQIFKLKILLENKFRVIKTHPRNRNKIKIYDATFNERFPVTDFVYVDNVEDILLFCALHNNTDSSLLTSLARTKGSREMEFKLSLKNVLCINPNKNFHDTWISSSLEKSLVDVHRSVSSRGLLFASQFRKKLSVEESRMLNVKQLRTVVSFDLGRTWSQLKLRNGCTLDESEPSLYLDQSFSRLFFDKPFLGIHESLNVPGLIIASGHLEYPGEEETYPGVFVSEDGGITWIKIFDERFLITVSKSGELLLGIRQCLSGTTSRFFISYDFGHNWKTYKIFDEEVCVHEVVESPFDVFVLLSSKVDQQMWIVSVMDFEKSGLEIDRCSRKDIHLWPTTTGDEKFCVNGHKVLNYRRNVDTFCRIHNFELKFLNFSCTCTEDDLICRQGNCKLNDTDHWHISHAKNDQEVQNIATGLGLIKRHKNKCIIKRQTFDKETPPLKECNFQKAFNMRDISTATASRTINFLSSFITLSLILLCQWPVRDLSANL